MCLLCCILTFVSIYVHFLEKVTQYTNVYVPCSIIQHSNMPYSRYIHVAYICIYRTVWLLMHMYIYMYIKDNTYTYEPLSFSLLLSFIVPKRMKEDCVTSKRTRCSRSWLYMYACTKNKRFRHTHVRIFTGFHSLL